MSVFSDGMVLGPMIGRSEECEPDSCLLWPEDRMKYRKYSISSSNIPMPQAVDFCLDDGTMLSVYNEVVALAQIYFLIRAVRGRKLDVCGFTRCVRKTSLFEQRRPGMLVGRSCRPGDESRATKSVVANLRACLPLSNSRSGALIEHNQQRGG